MTSTKRGLVDIGIVLSGAITVAFAGLLAEDFFPARDKDSGWGPVFSLQTNCWRIFFCIFFGFALLVLLSQRKKITEKQGTLFYLYAQPESFPDYHAKVSKEVAQHMLDYRRASQVFYPSLGIIDVRQQVSYITAELERGTNDDRHDSGLQIAPNMTFPIALAVGYDWSPGPSVEFKEYNGNGDKPQFSFKLEEEPACGRCTIDSRDVEQVQIGRGVASSVWLTFKFIAENHDKAETTNYESVDDKKDLRNKSHYARVVGWYSEENRDKILHTTMSDKGIATKEDKELSASQLAAEVAHWILQTLTDYPKATVYVSGQLPKTVAFLAGYYLRVSQVKYKEATYPWRRIVPMAFLLGEENPDRPMWVRDSQTDPAVLIKESGLTWPSTTEGGPDAD